MTESSPPTKPLNTATGALAGLRVIELGQLVAGPFCAQMLGDHGAEVIKIEAPGQPDPLRQWGQVLPQGLSMWFATTARNKRCATLNLRVPAGRDALLRLAAISDVLVENFRPGTLEKWGLGYGALSAVNPGLILVRVSGYGQTGPAASKAGYAAVGEAFGGLRALMGEANRKPSRAGISLGDTVAGLQGAIGALAALEARRRTGRGQVVDVALYESVLALTESLVPDFQQAGFVRQRSGSVLPKIAPSNIYACADGEVVIAANQDSVFARLAEAMGEPGLASNPRYATHQARGQVQIELDELIEAWSRQRPMAEVETICEAHGVPCGRLIGPADMMGDPHYRARDALSQVEHPQLGPLLMPNVTPKLSETPGAVNFAGRPTGADNGYVFEQLLGYDAAEIEALKAAGVI
jgi:crotonobetainyl-CoA:carnitine CoA-transferase CaiB-like acyl-CoA transferase